MTVIAISPAMRSRSISRDGEYAEDEVNRFLERLFYVSVDARSDQGWSELKGLLDEGRDRVRAFYLAVGPGLFGDISERIRANGLVTDLTPHRGGKADRARS
jgi:glucose-6-phosphate 1-dehydrogenase